MTRFDSLSSLTFHRLSHLRRQTPALRISGKPNPYQPVKVEELVAEFNLQPRLRVPKKTSGRTDELLLGPCLSSSSLTYSHQHMTATMTFRPFDGLDNGCQPEHHQQSVELQAPYSGRMMNAKAIAHIKSKLSTPSKISNWGS